MSVRAMSEMGKARKSRRTLGRFCLSWEDLCGVGVFLLFWFRFFVFWLVVSFGDFGGGGGLGLVLVFGLFFVIFIYLV